MAKETKMIDWRCKSGRLTELDIDSPFKAQYIGFDCVGFINGKQINAEMVGISIRKKK